MSCRRKYGRHENLKRRLRVSVRSRSKAPVRNLSEKDNVSDKLVVFCIGLTM